MFLGKYDSVLNDKKRMTLPARIVKHLTNQQLVIGKGFEECIYGYEINAWEKQTQEYFNAPLLDKKARSVRRFIFANSVIVTYDRQGRIVIPPFLYAYAKFVKDLMIIGAGDHFEIWNRSTWQTYEKSLSSV